MQERKCNNCNEIKPLEAFYKCNSCKLGRANICGKCYIQRYKYDTGKSIPGRKRVDTDKELAEVVLTVLGYELGNPNNPIHEQFLKKHNLPT